ncbi:MAG: hypothetical protein LBP76_06605 [Treponema sp.]|jgi:hypothetical protein|nr:hypothetical protein [Treponema sp.]
MKKAIERQNVKQAIELLENLKVSLKNLYDGDYVRDFAPCYIESVENAIAELKTPASYKISDAVDVLTEARAFIEKGHADDGIDKIGAAISILDELSVPPPRWETPEQWKERTGEDWPDGNAVYVRQADGTSPWIVQQHLEVRVTKWLVPITIICATEAGKPPKNWKPEAQG